MKTRRREHDFHDEPDNVEERSMWRRIFGNRPLETLALFFVLVAVATVAANALYGQPRAHPAPLFATAKPVAVLADASIITGAVARKIEPSRAEPTRLAAVSPDAAKATAPTRAQLIGQIQRELQRRGYYGGTIDGLDGPRTDAAIRDAEQALGQRPSGEPSEALLTALSRLAPRQNPPVAQAVPPRDQIAALIDPQPRIIDPGLRRRRPGDPRGDREIRA
jgi:Putative peptidoglycan binding domain